MLSFLAGFPGMHLADRPKAGGWEGVCAQSSKISRGCGNRIPSCSGRLGGAKPTPPDGSCRLGSYWPEDIASPTPAEERCRPRDHLQ